MNIKNILENYNEYIANYYMNDQVLLDNDLDRKVAEYIATETSIENDMI